MIIKFKTTDNDRAKELLSDFISVDEKGAWIFVCATDFYEAKKILANNNIRINEC